MIPVIDYTSQLHESRTYKERGNAHFAEQRYKEAIKQYNYGLLQVASLGSPPTALGDSTSLSSQAMECGDMEATLRLNLAACFLKLGNYSRNLQECSKVLKLRPENTKAQFRKAQSLVATDRIEEAAELLQKIRQAGKDDISVQTLQKEIRKKEIAVNNKQIRQMSGFLNR